MCVFVRGLRTDARAQTEDALLPRHDIGSLEPFSAIIVGPQQAAAADMFIRGKLRQGALQLRPRQVQSKVIYLFPGGLERLQKQTNLSKVASHDVSYKFNVRAAAGAVATPYPLPSSTIIEPAGIPLAISAAEDSRMAISSLVR